MQATATQQDFNTGVVNPLTPIKGELIDANQLNLLTVRETLKLLMPDAIKKAISLIEKSMKNDESMVGGFVRYSDSTSKKNVAAKDLKVSYVRVIKKVKLPAIHEKHPQFKPIEEHPDWCIIVHQRSATHPKCCN